MVFGNGVKSIQAAAYNGAHTVDGYLLHRTCVFKALRLFFLSNFPGPTLIRCPTSITDSRVVTCVSTRNYTVFMIMLLQK